MARFRCTRCRSCPVVSPAFFVAPACKPSSRRYLIGRVFCFQNSCEGKYSLLIQILKGKMATDFAQRSRIFMWSSTNPDFEVKNGVCFAELFIKYLHLTCLIGISLHIQIYPAKYNHISPNGAGFLRGLLLIQLLRVKCAVSSQKISNHLQHLSHGWTIIAENTTPRKELFLLVLLDFEKHLLLIVIFEGKNAGVFNNIYETFKKQPPCMAREVTIQEGCSLLRAEC